MKIGFHLPQWGVGATRDGILSVARAVEENGLDSVWVADHIVLPSSSQSSYPYKTETPFSPEDGFLEALTMLASVASVTERVVLGTSVLVLPMREPLLVAKVVATIDVLSNGRTLLAVGAGWMEDEFRALGASFPGRGRRFDEQIRVVQRLWCDGRARFDGEFYHFDEIVCEPRPIQVGGPPLLIGGMGKAAWRRAAELGNGWHAVGVHAETLSRGIRAIRSQAATFGRDANEIGLSTSTILPDDDAVAVRRLARLASVGVDHVVLNVEVSDPSEVCRRIEHFGKTVLPRLREEMSESPIASGPDTRSIPSHLAVAGPDRAEASSGPSGAAMSPA